MNFTLIWRLWMYTCFQLHNRPKHKHEVHCPSRCVPVRYYHLCLIVTPTFQLSKQSRLYRQSDSCVDQQAGLWPSNFAVWDSQKTFHAPVWRRRGKQDQKKMWGEVAILPWLRRVMLMDSTTFTAATASLQVRDGSTDGYSTSSDSSKKRKRRKHPKHHNSSFSSNYSTSSNTSDTSGSANTSKLASDYAKPDSSSDSVSVSVGSSVGVSVSTDTFSGTATLCVSFFFLFLIHKKKKKRFEDELWYWRWVIANHVGLASRKVVWRARVERCTRTRIM